MSIEAMKQALEALQANDVLINGSGTLGGLAFAMDGYYSGCFDIDGTNEKTEQAITTLREAIAKAEKHEPVRVSFIRQLVSINKDGIETWEEKPLYAAPSKREWIGLAVNEAQEFYESNLSRADLINKIDEFLEEKNCATAPVSK
jgi:hypothetical protein